MKLKGRKTLISITLLIFGFNLTFLVYSFLTENPTAVVAFASSAFFALFYLFMLIFYPKQL